MSSKRKTQEKDERAHVGLFISLAGLSSAKSTYGDKTDCVLHLHMEL